MHKNLSNFEKLLVIKIFKPEKILPAVQKYLELEIGKIFAHSPLASLESVFKASDVSTPIIFVLQ